MRVAIVSTYRPKACGIAVFTGDLRDAILRADPETVVDVVALVDANTPRPSAPEVLTTIARDDPDSYRAASRVLEQRGADVVLLEHEYGLFGGEAGAAVVALAESLSQPLVLTLHTVLSDPSAAQLDVLRRLGAQAALTTVFTQTAREMIIAQQVSPPARVRVVPHGAPDLLRDAAPARLGAGRTIVSTFGLISAGKGIGTAIAALPKVVAQHPEVLYLVVGQTHPEVVRHDGETYRDGLRRQVADLDLGGHVRFVDGFAPVEEIAGLLAATDIYLTPYRSREQIVSGALTFAVAAGCPVVSTPYLYAEDLLASGAGVLVPFDDPDALSTAVLDLLDDPHRLAAARAEARRIGAGLSWSHVGADSLGVLREAVGVGRRPVPGQPVAREGTDTGPGRASRGRVAAGPPGVDLRHLSTLVDDVGIIQHAHGSVPNRRSGYCTDDVARLLLVDLALRGEGAGLPDEPERSVAFLLHAWEPMQPGIRNFLGYDRVWCDEPHAGDHLGRTLWALGTLLASATGAGVAQPVRRMFDELLPAAAASRSPREAAFAVLGLAARPLEDLDRAAGQQLRELTQRLADWFAGCGQPGWWWFEDYLTYDNARLPQALLMAGDRLGVDSWVAAGRQALDWYAGQCGVAGDCVRLVGNRWRQAAGPAGDGPRSPEGDEQAVDAAALVEALVTAAEVTGAARYAAEAEVAFGWFGGRNRLGVPLVDPLTGGCRDGLGEYAVNDNQGAESTLAFLQAALSVRRLRSRRAS